MRLAGPAFTVHVPAFDNLWIHRAVYAAREGDILVISTSGGLEAGYWGDILNEAAIAQNLGGIVIDGGVRDSAGLIRNSLPVFSNGVSIRGTVKGREAIAWLRQPIRIGEIVVKQDDLVMGDADGVVVIPARDVGRVIDAGTRRESDETEKIARIRAGERTIDLYGIRSIMIAQAPVIGSAHYPDLHQFIGGHWREAASRCRAGRHQPGDRRDRRGAAGGFGHRHRRGARRSCRQRSDLAPSDALRPRQNHSPCRAAIA